MAPCPCGSGKSFDSCCGPYIDGQATPTPEALMRSRYAAFTIGDIDYIEKTCTENAAQLFNRVDMERSLPDVDWLGIEVRDTSGGKDGDNVGTVNFIVRYRYNGRDFNQAENASFQRVGGVWLYDQSEINPKSPPVRVARIGRNTPCPCGSGKKYKKCCGQSA